MGLFMSECHLFFLLRKTHILLFALFNHLNQIFLFLYLILYQCRLVKCGKEFTSSFLLFYELQWLSEQLGIAGCWREWPNKRQQCARTDIHVKPIQEYFVHLLHRVHGHKWTFWVTFHQRPPPCDAQMKMIRKQRQCITCLPQGPPHLKSHTDSTTTASLSEEAVLSYLNQSRLIVFVKRLLVTQALRLLKPSAWLSGEENGLLRP